MLALKPYWGKPTVRNFREDDGNVGIIRSPLRAIVLPEFKIAGVRVCSVSATLSLRVENIEAAARQELSRLTAWRSGRL